MIQIYHHNRCSKSRQAIALLEDKGVDFTVRYYVESPLNKAELIALQKKLDIPFIAMVRTNEALYTTLFGKDIPNDDQLLQAVIDNPILLQRPIVETNEHAVIARPPEKLLAII